MKWKNLTVSLEYYMIDYNKSHIYVCIYIYIYIYIYYHYKYLPGKEQN